jgi:competence protein ComEC
LWPEVADADAALTAKNNDSLVLRLKFRNRALLLPGDAEKQAEQAMLAGNSEGDLHADVLKVGHHGSKNSTTPEFLEAVRPQVAVISAGEDNPYGHPSPELLERLQSAGARVLRTDRDGAVHILTDGDKLEISCFVACDNLTTVTVSGSAQAPDQDQNREQ